MRKLLSIALSLLLMCSLSTVAFAANTTTLTTTVPDATYTLNIPADQEIPFGATSEKIGNITVTNSSGFSIGKDLQITLTYDAFKSDGVSTTIPYTIYKAVEKRESGSNTTRVDKTFVGSGSSLTFIGKSNGSVNTTFEYSGDYVSSTEHLRIVASSEDWSKALAGEYSSTITFTAEVVVSEP